MPVELKERLTQRARERKRTVNQLIVETLTERLGAHRKEEMASSNGSENGHARGNGKVRVAMIGVGNCANSLLQGVQYYKDADPEQFVPGLMLEWGDLDIVANFVKVAAVVCVAWWFLAFFEALSWVLLIAVLIVPVDIFSVARGPTKEIVENQPQVFNALSISFPLPGEHNSAQLGLPDVLFFSLFLGAADRFGLRIGLTWILMTLSFGATLALAVGFDISGLPALPLLSVAFVLANADHLWRYYKDWRSARDSK